MLVFGPIDDEQEHAVGWKTLYEEVQQCLGFAIDPVQVLEEHHEWLLAAFTVEEGAHTIQHLATLLYCIKGLPCRVGNWHVQQGEKRRDHGHQRAVEGEELARDLLADATGVIVRDDPEIRLEKLDDG